MDQNSSHAVDVNWEDQNASIDPRDPKRARHNWSHDFIPNAVENTGELYENISYVMVPSDNSTNTHVVTQYETQIQRASRNMMNQQLFEVRLALFEEQMVNLTVNMISECKENVKMESFGSVWREIPVEGFRERSFWVLTAKIPWQPN